ncbi:putative membrane protein [Verticillium dahliae VDG2]|nr:putative membrane protein [Verticillium dahliae VDG2]
MVMNTEDDLHFPTLKVAETIDFAASTKATKAKFQTSEMATTSIDKGVKSTLETLGIAHTSDTVVGNEFIRGVSGGERKRVSIAEVMETGAPLQCWDNSTRGLDASNALDFVKALRRAANEQQKSIVATLYQAGNSIYSQFDKVLLLAEGRQIYYGSTRDARKYFEDMGFLSPPGANTADFLTSVVVETERLIRSGFEDSVPQSAPEFETRYRNSAMYRQMMEDIDLVSKESLSEEIRTLNSVCRLEKTRTIEALSRYSSPYHVSFLRQVGACTKRQFRIIWGDRWSNCLQIASSFCFALVTGSLFYNLSDTSDSVFMKPGALFYPILLFAMNKLSETTVSFTGRPIIARHKRLAFHRPAAHAMACVITDIPLVVALFTLFHIIFYFMVGLQHEAGKFFTNWLIYVLATLCFTSLFRMIGACCRHFGFASQISGWVIMAMMVYGGYLIPVASIHPWFRWIWYINPAAYAFNAVLASEMGTMTLTCVEPQYVPFGSTYNESAYRSCTVAGSAPALQLIDGESFLQVQYRAMVSEIWRNVGILVAFWFLFALLTALASELNIHRDTGSSILFHRRNQRKEMSRLQDSEEAAKRQPATSDSESENKTSHLVQTVFTFKDISYYVRHQGREKQLLKDVSGFVKPGQLVALMGSSGAGKTTLMDVLAQRKDGGRIEGSIMVNGKPQGISFQRTTGYCEQNDVHEPTATVLESLLFSARLRQSFGTPDSDKVQHVQHIMDLLELTSLKHALVGNPGSGLSIEQRKRLTLATELVAKPSLLFLDEPTSGLDGQSAYQICRFMRRLAASGQTIICTIHQPSAALFEAFDVLLLLTKGGKTTYFGPTGKNSDIVLDYFSRNGAPCDLDANPAEHIVDVVQGRFGPEIDWAQTWIDSQERISAMQELEHLNKPGNFHISGTQISDEDEKNNDDILDFAAPLFYQVRLVTRRQMVALWRNPDYVWNKIGLHVSNSLFGGFTYWMIGDGLFDLQLRLMAVFNFVFVAPGCINQLQPLFLRNRDIFETREKKSKTYHWFAFIMAQLISEIPLLILCGTLYFACWYFTAGFPVEASISGQVYLEMILYEFLYTSIAQAIAAYSPNEYFAALANPLIVGTALINFCGVAVPYARIQAFWRYWLYYLNPFTYLMGALLQPVIWDVEVECKASELTHIDLPQNTTCGEYMDEFLAINAGYVTDITNETSCAYCPYSTGADYLRTMNINGKYYGWRDHEDLPDENKFDQLDGGEDEFYKNQMDYWYWIDDAQCSGPRHTADQPNTKFYNHGIGSLRGFETLEILLLDVKVFLGARSDGCGSLFTELAWEPPDRLVNALPPNLVTLTLYDYAKRNNPAVDALVVQLLNTKSGDEPRLEAIYSFDKELPCKDRERTATTAKKMRPTRLTVTDSQL